MDYRKRPSAITLSLRNTARKSGSNVSCRTSFHTLQPIKACMGSIVSFFQFRLTQLFVQHVQLLSLRCVRDGTCAGEQVKLHSVIETTVNERETTLLSSKEEGGSQFMRTLIKRQDPRRPQTQPCEMKKEIYLSSRKTAWGSPLIDQPEMLLLFTHSTMPKTSRDRQ